MKPTVKDKSNKIKLGITHGDINGISYEVIIKSLLDFRINEFFTPILYGSPKVFAYHRKSLGIDNFSLNSIRHPSEANPKRSNIINCTADSIKVELGRSTKAAGDAAFKALERVVEDIKSGDIDIVVTAPINKENIQSNNFAFPGHTEYFKHKFEAEDVLMLMVSNKLRVGVVTGHIPIRDVATSINKDLILSKIRIMHNSLAADFGIEKPKIAVLGLNPHAGDNGLIGTEELEVILPAIKQAQSENILALGAYPADGFFGSQDYTKFDGILAMYHDQGLTPFKSLAFEHSVNYTAGLSCIRTSPGHGTAYDIAGTRKASPNSFRQAMYLALDIFRNRKRFTEQRENKLDDLVDN